MNIPFKLKEKLIIITVGTIMLAIGLNTYFYTKDFIGLYRQSAEEKVLDRLKRFEGLIEEVNRLGIGLKGLDGINEECANVVSEATYGIYCFVTDGQGKVFYHSSPREVGRLYDDPLTRRALDLEGSVIQEQKLDGFGRVHDFSLPVNNSKGERIGVVRLGVKSDFIEEGIGAILRRSAYLGLMLVVVGSVLIYLLFRRNILVPIQLLKKGLDDFGSGDFEAKVELKTRDEINDIGVAFNQMIAGHKRILQTLQGSETRFRSVIESSHDAVIISDSKGTILEWNKGAENFFGYAPREAIGQPLTLLIPEEYRKEHVAGLNRAGETSQGRLQGRSLELEGLRKDGTLFPIEISFSAWHIGKEMFFGAIIRDLTERKRVEKEKEKIRERLLQSDKMDAVGQLAGGVAHDFNNLLSAIGGQADFLADSFPAGDPRREEVGEIQKAAQRGSELVRQLLVFGKREVTQPKAVNLNLISADMSKMLHRLIDASVEMVILQGKDLKLIYADAGQIQQVILNLALNARDAMPRGGTLIIETKNVEIPEGGAGEKDPPGGSWVRLTVKDTGAGMSPEIQKRIFEPFFTTKGGRGTGLGLATVQSIVQHWKGHLQLESAPGAGTTFVIHFPAFQGKPEAEAPPPSKDARAHGNETILVAEDEEPVRKVVTRTLEKYGYHVLQAVDGIEAVKKFWDKKEPIHLLLTDAVMPRMNGRELADELKYDRPGLKVLFMSGYPRGVLSQQGVIDPSIHLIQKPFSGEELAVQVRKILDEK